MLELQRKHRRTIFFVSHDLEEALKIGSRIGIMEGGNLVQEGSLHEIITRPANDYVRRFFKGVDTSRYLTAADLVDSTALPADIAALCTMSNRLPATTTLPDALHTVLGLDQPVSVFDDAEHLVGCITPKSLLSKIANTRHVS